MNSSDVVEVVRARLEGGRTVNDWDVHQLVALIDTLRAAAARNCDQAARRVERETANADQLAKAVWKAGNRHGTDEYRQAEILRLCVAALREPPRRGFSDPMFEQGHQSEHDQVKLATCWRRQFYWSARTLRCDVWKDGEDAPPVSEDVLGVDKDRCIYPHDYGDLIVDLLNRQFSNG